MFVESRTILRTTAPLGVVYMLSAKRANYSLRRTTNISLRWSEGHLCVGFYKHVTPNGAKPSAYVGIRGWIAVA